LWADASTNLSYAKIQQEGGTITAKNAKALFVPAGAKTRALMRSYGASTPRGLIAAMRADNYGFFSAGRVFFAYKKGKNKRGKEFALFIITHSVKIPARPFLFIDDQDEAYLMKLVQDGVANALGGNGA
jgi:phage gpG-like protein